MTPTEAFQDLHNMIENAVAVKAACDKLIQLIEEGAEKNELLGMTGMAGRSEVMKRADFPRWKAMSDEYTDLAQNAVMAMINVCQMVRGVAEGMDSTFAAKRSMSN